ncbi:arrestin domain-containing protein 17-like [Papilio machaon]|uniref:arrestin domain-containing protein 17-like n=1 Tax=Papilio machaon TaxID=76193 RepID=UPI001E663360|nr:arrestin domain-containing protein 17-like [Papilio machaon]
MGIFCEINLHKSHNGVFVAGGKVHGVIRYALDVETTFTEIYVSLKGKGILRIKEKHNDKSKEFTHCSSEDYLDLKNVVTESDMNVIPTGSYDIPFNFELPENIPPTFRHSSSNIQYAISCNIQYHIRIKFKRPGFLKFAKMYKKEIEVESGITPRLPLDPIIYGKQKKLSQLFSRKSNTITMKAGVAKSVVAPGDKLELEYEVKNDSNTTVKAVETKIVEVLKFTTKAKTVNVSRDVPHAECKTGSVACGESQAMRLLLDVPADIRSLDFSGIVARDYFVQMTVELPFPHFNCVLLMPLQVGQVEQVGQGGRGCAATPPPSYWEVMPDDDKDHKE